MFAIIIGGVLGLIVVVVFGVERFTGSFAVSVIFRSVFMAIGFVVVFVSDFVVEAVYILKICVIFCWLSGIVFF